MKTACSVVGCVSSRRARGFCMLHYKRFMAHGTTDAAPSKSGLGSKNSNGYIQIGGVKKKQHILVAERALGKPLPKGALVHHVNERRDDNRNENLVICPSLAYHALIHQRMRALAACGNADWRKCPLCKRYDDPRLMRKITSNNSFYHPACVTPWRNAKRGAIHVQ